MVNSNNSEDLIKEMDEEKQFTFNNITYKYNQYSIFKENIFYAFNRFINRFYESDKILNFNNLIESNLCEVKEFSEILIKLFEICSFDEAEHAVEILSSSPLFSNKKERNTTFNNSVEDNLLHDISENLKQQTLPKIISIMLNSGRIGLATLIIKKTPVNLLSDVFKDNSVLHLATNCAISLDLSGETYLNFLNVLKKRRVKVKIDNKLHQTTLLSALLQNEDNIYNEKNETVLGMLFRDFRNLDEKVLTKILTYLPKKVIFSEIDTLCQFLKNSDLSRYDFKYLIPSKNSSLIFLCLTDYNLRRYKFNYDKKSSDLFNREYEPFLELFNNKNKKVESNSNIKSFMNSHIFDVNLIGEMGVGLYIKREKMEISLDEIVEINNKLNESRSIYKNKR